MFQAIGEVIENRQMREDIHLLTLSSPEIAEEAKPGQFVQVRVRNHCHPLLRRPFSFHRVEGGRFKLLYKTVGRGTKLLSEVRPGEVLDLIGPLGHGFEVGGVESPLVVAGGIGFAPLLFLTERLLGAGPTVLIGAATKDKILGEEEAKSLGVEVRIATEDGTLGTRGVVTDLLSASLRRTNSVFACGPRDMLTEVAKICRKKGNPCQISLEERMGCGVGACLVCAVKSSGGGYKRVCSDGPVFHSSEVVL